MKTATAIRRVLSRQKKALAQSRANYDALMKDYRALTQKNHSQAVVIFRLKRGLRELLET